MKRSKKFKLDKEAINKIDSEYDDRDLSDYTNYEVYEEEKPRHRFLKKLVKRLIIPVSYTHLTLPTTERV